MPFDKNMNCFISMIISVDTLCGFAPYRVTADNPSDDYGVTG